MKTLVKKLKNKKGFTLMEMLIVVAIMVILVAVSIPVFSSQLDKAKKATDDANVRAAKALVLTSYMAGFDDVTITAGREYWYDASNGVLVDSTVSGATAPTGYGQQTGVKGKYIIVKIDSTTGTAKYKWNGEAAWK